MRAFSYALISCFLALWPLAHAHAEGILVRYRFPIEGYSIDLPAEWKPHSVPEDSAALGKWGRKDGTEMEIYGYKGRKIANVRRDVARNDRETKTNCGGMPIVTVRFSRWITIGGKRALLREEKSCIVDQSFLQIYVAQKKHVAEITIWNKSRQEIKPRDMKIAEEVLQTFRFIDEKPVVMPRWSDTQIIPGYRNRAPSLR